MGTDEAAYGRAAAFRGAGGRLSVLSSGRDAFAIKKWLAADGDNRTPKDAGLHDGVACDAVASASSPMAGSPRWRSTLRLSPRIARAPPSAREAPGACAATLIDRKAWRLHGAIALRWNGDRFEQTFGQPPGYERPWAPATRSAATTRPASVPQVATPGVEDLEPGD